MIEPRHARPRTKHPFVLAAITLLRRPGVAVPGLLGGLFVALAWIAMSGFTFTSFITRVWSAWTVPLLFFVVPAAVGVIATLWCGSAVAGRRTARLAGISAGLGIYLYGTLAVAVVGAGGEPIDSGFTVTSTVTDRLGNNIIFYLALLPLVTATFGWAASAATAHLRPKLAGADLVSFEAYGVAAPVPHTVGSAAPAQTAPRTALSCCKMCSSQRPQSSSPPPCWSAEPPRSSPP